MFPALKLLAVLPAKHSMVVPFMLTLTGPAMVLVKLPSPNRVKIRLQCERSNVWQFD